MSFPRPEHLSVLDLAARQPMLDQTLDWASINSGTCNLAGLAAVAGKLADAFVALPGPVALLDADPHDVHIHLHGGFARPPKPLDPAAERLLALVRDCGSALGQHIAWAPTGGVCDGNNIAAAGVPVIDTMGARGGAIHSGEEFLIVESLAERARLSTLVLLALAERGQP